MKEATHPYQTVFPLDKLIEIQSQPSEYRMLERVPFTRKDLLSRLPVQLNVEFEDEVIKNIVFYADNDALKVAKKLLPFNSPRHIVLVKCAYSKSRNTLVSIKSILETTIQANGDQESLLPFFADNPLVVAFNAPMMRRGFDFCCPLFANLPWACAKQEIDWRERGYSTAIESMIFEHGYFIGNHDAKDYALAVANLMYEHEDYFDELLKSARETRWNVYASKLPYKYKDAIKQRKYSFDYDCGCWYKECKTDVQRDEEIAFLQQLYDVNLSYVVCIKTNATNRYKIYEFN